MVPQNLLRNCEGYQVFFSLLNFRFAIGAELNKSLKRSNCLLYSAHTHPELLSNTSIVDGTASGSLRQDPELVLQRHTRASRLHLTTSATPTLLILYLFWARQNLCPLSCSMSTFNSGRGFALKK